MPIEPTSGQSAQTSAQNHDLLITIGGKVELSEVVNGMCEPSHLLDIHGGRSFYCIARNEFGGTISDLAAGSNAYTYDGLL